MNSFTAKKILLILEQQLPCFTKNTFTNSLLIHTYTYTSTYV